MSQERIPAPAGGERFLQPTCTVSREEQSLISKLVFRELLVANTALAAQDLHERTLLPEATVHAALAELEAQGLCTAHQQSTDRRSQQYVAVRSPGPES